MPGMNGKGPLGNGPRSGGQRGACKQTGITPPDQARDTPTDAVPGQGKGQGLGRAKVAPAVAVLGLANEAVAEKARDKAAIADKELVCQRP